MATPRFDREKLQSEWKEIRPTLLSEVKYPEDANKNLKKFIEKYGKDALLIR